MIPKEIALQLTQVKEKVKTYSFIQRSLAVYERRDEVDEIKEILENVNSEISVLTKKTDNILVDGLISKFEIDSWVEGLKIKTDFHELNPRLVFEEEQLELERQKKITEEKTKQELEEFNQELKTERLKEYQDLCFNGPDDFYKIRRLINKGFDIAQEGRIYDLSTLISRGRSLEFISFLIEAGMKINEEEKQNLQYRINIEQIRAKNVIEEYQKKLKKRRDDEFKTIWYYGPDDIDKVQQLLINGLDIFQVDESPSIKYLIARGRGIKFIKFLISAGLKITIQDFEFCLKNNSIYNSPEFVNFILSAKNIDQKTIVMAKAALKQKEEDDHAEKLAWELTSKVSLKQKEEDERILLEQESILSKLKELTQGKYNSFYKLLKDGNINEIEHVFSFCLFDINHRIKENESEVTHSILSIFETRGIEFIQMLVDSGYLVTKEDIDHYYNTEYSKLYYLNCKEFPYFNQIINILISAKNIEKEAVDKVKEIRMEEERIRQKHVEIEKNNKIKVQTQRIDEFRKMCEYGQENIFKLKGLINEGLDIVKIADFDCLMSCMEHRKRNDFVLFLVDSGILVTNKHIKYCNANTKYFTDPLSLINILENAKNIDSKALEDILKRKKEIVILFIFFTCICIISLFMPQILNRETNNFFYIFIGIITILSLLLSISFIVELRKKLKITSTIYLHGNQLPRRKQTEYEIPNAQGIIGLTGSVKEFNHKEIKEKKMILWMVVTLISISIIALIYIYFEEVIVFLKAMLIIIIVFALFAWRYSPTKRR